MTFDELCAAQYKNITVALFYGLNCKPCELLHPKLEEVCKKLGVRLERFNSSLEIPALKRMGLRSVPSVVLVHPSGIPALAFSGDRTKAEIEQLLTRGGVRNA
jgi:thiol-disulfide isomerase/thioredoxin